MKWKLIIEGLPIKFPKRYLGRAICCIEVSNGNIVDEEIMIFEKPEELKQDRGAMTHFCLLPKFPPGVKVRAWRPGQ